MEQPELEKMRHAVSKSMNFPTYMIVGDTKEEIQARANALIIMRYGKTQVARDKMTLVKDIIEGKEGVKSDDE